MCFFGALNSFIVARFFFGWGGRRGRGEGSRAISYLSKKTFLGKDTSSSFYGGRRGEAIMRLYSSRASSEPNDSPRYCVLRESGVVSLGKRGESVLEIQEGGRKRDGYVLV